MNNLEQIIITKDLSIMECYPCRTLVRGDIVKGKYVEEQKEDSSFLFIGWEVILSHKHGKQTIRISIDNAALLKSTMGQKTFNNFVRLPEPDNESDWEEYDARYI